MDRVIGRKVFITTLLVCCHATAQPPAPDFSPGFAKLAALGMPALDSQAKWSSLPDSGVSNYQLREITKSLKGNTWLLPSTGGKIRTIPMGGTEITETDPSDKSKPARQRKSAAPQDLAKDTAALISALRKTAAKRDPDDDYSYRSRGSSFGSFLLFATQLYQTGRAESANQLALAVFEHFPSREAAVDAAIDEIASHLYQKAAREFFRSGDWAAYHQALASLTKRFPRGWSGRDAVAMFLPQLEKQATGAQAPPPTIPDVPIDPQAVAIIRELTEKPPAAANPTDTPPTENIPPELRYRMQMMGSMAEYQIGDQYTPSALWLIQDSSSEAENKSPLARLAGLKLAALPALAALATDPFLTHIPNPQSYSGYYSSDESSEERAIRAYNSLNRPATRGEIAKRLLAATLPDPQNELDEADPETIRDLALTFWKEHKNSTREQIAAVFLRDGSQSQTSVAASSLAASSDPEAHRIFETHVLASEQAIASFQEVQIYLKSRKAAAKPFLESYTKLVRSQSREPSGEHDPYAEDSHSWEIKQAGGVNKILKQLETLVGSQSPRALAVQIAKGKPEDAENAIKSLTTLLADASPTKHLFTLLEGANAATHEETRAEFLTATFEISWPDSPSHNQEPKPPPTPRNVSDPEAKVWRKLLADEREIPGAMESAANDPEDKPTIANLAALTFEHSVAPWEFYQIQRSSGLFTQPLTVLFKERATARLAGKSLAPLPDATKISKERLASIVATAAAKTPAEIHPFLATLTLDERAAWSVWFNEPGDLPVPPAVCNLKNVVIRRSSFGGTFGDDAKHFANIEVGFAISASSLQSLIQTIAADPGKHSRGVVVFFPASFGPGLQVAASILPLPKEKQNDPAAADSSDALPSLPTGDSEDEDPSNTTAVLKSRLFHVIKALEEDPDADGAIHLAFVSGDSSVRANWLVHKGKPQLKPGQEPAGDPIAFIQSATQSPEVQRLQLQIQILSRADSEKISTSND